MAYTRTYRDFAGIDVSSEPSEVHDRRFAYAMNVWKDYHNENGEAVETAPGFRVLAHKNPELVFSGKLNGLHYFPGDTPYLIVHIGETLYVYKVIDTDGIVSLEYMYYKYQSVADATSKSIFHYGKLYIVDGVKYRVMYESSVEQEIDGKLKIVVELKMDDVETSAYIPTTSSNSEPYEQRNLMELRGAFICKYTIKQDGDEHECVLFDPCTNVENVTINGTGIKLYKLSPPEDVWWNAAKYSEVSVIADDGTVLYKVITDKTKKISEVIKDATAKVNDAPDPLSSGGRFNNVIRNSEFDVEGAELLYAKKTAKGENIGTQEEIVLYMRYKGQCWAVDKTSSYGNLPQTEVVIGDKIEGKRYVHSLIISTLPKEMATVDVVIEGYADPQRFFTLQGQRDALSGAPDFQSNKGATAREAINGCTIIEEFDGKIFLSGNPKYPNTIFYSHSRADTGINDPSYIGAYNYLNDGTGSTPITAMISTPTNLIVFKDDVAQGSSVYYHQAQYNPSDDEITANLQPRVYPREQGVPNVGCVGCATNFLDDPVFLSTKGLEAVGKSQVNLERSLAHRSYLVDAELINEDLRNARFAEWDGYLCILVPGGKMYLADSRQIDSAIHGHRQYEWYKWDGIGVHTTKTKRYRYATINPVEGEKYEGLDIVIDGSGGYINGELTSITVNNKTYYASRETRDGIEYWFVAEWHGEYTGKDEDFQQATALLSLGGRLYFGCEDGTVCMFTTNERDKNHRLCPQAYIREREEEIIKDENGNVSKDENGNVITLYTGLGYRACMATKSDHCGRTNVAKSTEKGTFVVKVKAYATTKMAVKVGVDGGEWTEYYNNSVAISKIDDERFDLDFASVSFNTADSFLIAIRERKRKWVEKQILFEGWCFKTPFGLISATYDFSVAGKVKLR